MSFHWLKKQAKEPASRYRLPIQIITLNPLSVESGITEAVMGQVEELRVVSEDCRCVEEKLHAPIGGHFGFTTGRGDEEQERVRAEKLAGKITDEPPALLGNVVEIQKTESCVRFTLWGNMISG